MANDYQGEPYEFISLSELEDLLESAFSAGNSGDYLAGEAYASRKALQFFKEKS